MHAAMQRDGYTLVSSLYGSAFSDYMGVAVAFPNDLYEMLDCSVARLGETANFRRPPRAAASPLAVAKRWLVSYPLSVLKAALAPVPPLQKALDRLGGGRGGGGRGTESPYELAQRRHNRIVFVRLRSRDSGAVFCVATYHMPCMFFNPPVMTVHAALAVQYVQRMAGKTQCYVLAGDFNFKPDSEMYEMVTTGRLSTDAASHPPVMAHEPWRPTAAAALKSAYAEANGEEPDFTNYAHINDDEPFIETLDYIFCSGACETLAVMPLPSREEVGGPLPNANEPSDHIMIGATLAVRGDFGRKSRVK